MSLREFWRLSAKDTKQEDFFVFHTVDDQRGIRLRPEYRRFMKCKRCGWWNPRKAARSGLHRDVKCPFRDRDALFSGDGRLVISRRCKRVLEGIPGVSLEYHVLPADSAFFVVFSRRRVVPPEDLRPTKSFEQALRRREPFACEGACRRCGRLVDVCLACEEYLKLSTRTTLSAAILNQGGREGYREAFLASSAVAERLKAATLKGLKLRRVRVETT